MKRNGFVSAVMIAIGMVVLGSGMCFAEMRFIVNANPAAFLVSPDADDFNATSGSLIEEIDGSTSWMPTVLGGVEFDTEYEEFDTGNTVYLVYAFTAGGGYLYNDAFRAPLVQGDAAVRFKISGIEIGPHVGVLYFLDPNWEGVSTISLDESIGLLGGISFTTTGERFKFFASADYVNGEFDVTGSDSWVPNKSELDYSGFLGQIGVIFRF